MHNTFIGYCQEQGIRLLKDDIRFIRQMTSKLPPAERRAVLKRYCSEWLLGCQETEISYQRENKGRYRANFWLLSTVDKR